MFFKGLETEVLKLKFRRQILVFGAGRNILLEFEIHIHIIISAIKHERGQYGFIIKIMGQCPPNGVLFCII